MEHCLMSSNRTKLDVSSVAVKTDEGSELLLHHGMLLHIKQNSTLLSSACIHN
jgi:hypothetical protein